MASLICLFLSIVNVAKSYDTGGVKMEKCVTNSPSFFSKLIFRSFVTNNNLISVKWDQKPHFIPWNLSYYKHLHSFIALKQCLDQRIENTRRHQHQPKWRNPQVVEVLTIRLSHDFFEYAPSDL